MSELGLKDIPLFLILTFHAKDLVLVHFLHFSLLLLDLLKPFLDEGLTEIEYPLA